MGKTEERLEPQTVNVCVDRLKHMSAPVASALGNLVLGVSTCTSPEARQHQGAAEQGRQVRRRVSTPGTVCVSRGMTVAPLLSFTSPRTPPCGSP